MNTELTTKVKNDFEKDFFKLMNNSIFEWTIQSVRKHGDIMTTDRSHLVLEPNCYTT